jgi:hypothetical protein
VSGKRQTPLDAGQLWIQATKRYGDPSDRRASRSRDAEWLRRAERAYRAGNYLHIANAITVCGALKRPPPSWLVDATRRTLRALAAGAKGKGGRHSNVLRRAAEAVADVESLMHLVHARREAIKDPVGYVEKTLKEKSKLLLPTTIARGADTIEKQAQRARRLLANSAHRDFIGANFAPRIIQSLIPVKE